MKIHTAWREGFRSFFELGLIILSALFLSNLALGPLELKIVLTLLALGLFFVGRLLDVDFTLLVVVAGVFATAFGMILGDWRRFVVDFFWLTVVGDFAVNKGYFFAFFVGFFFFLFVFIILKMQKNRSEKYP